jgi:hypothetical protein
MEKWRFIMQCEEFKTRITELFDKNVDSENIDQLKKHMDNCVDCLALYESWGMEIRILSPKSVIEASSGLKQKIIQQAKMEEKLMENTKIKKPNYFRKHSKWIAAAASIVFFLVLILVVDNNRTFISSAKGAENLMLSSLDAMSSLRSMFIKMDVRSEPAENFDFFDKDKDFIEYKFWKQLDGKKPWKIEKPGRLVCFDGKEQFLLINETYAVKGSIDYNYVEWMKIFLEPQKMMAREIALSKETDATYHIGKTFDETILTIESKAQGKFPVEEMKNRSVMGSDNVRVYIFDNKSMLLKEFKFSLKESKGVFLIMKTNKIDYNIDIDPAIFAIQLKKGVKWHEDGDPEKVIAFTDIDSRTAAIRFFNALKSKDYKTIEPIWDDLKMLDQNSLNELKNEYGGLEIVEIGKSFSSGLYPGEFVPYKIRLKSGDIIEHRISLRNDNPHKVWIVDGGI